MANYLCTVTEVYRCDTEDSAKQLIETSKHNPNYELKKYNCEFKERKQKGEIVDAWYKVSLTKNFNDEKEPESDIQLWYGYDEMPAAARGEEEDED